MWEIHLYPLSSSKGIGWGKNYKSIILNFLSIWLPRVLPSNKESWSPLSLASISKSTFAQQPILNPAARVVRLRHPSDHIIPLLKLSNGSVWFRVRTLWWPTMPWAIHTRTLSHPSVNSLTSHSSRHLAHLLLPEHCKQTSTTGPLHLLFLECSFPGYPLSSPPPNLCSMFLVKPFLITLLQIAIPANNPQPLCFLFNEPAEICILFVSGLSPLETCFIRTRICICFVYYYLSNTWNSVWNTIGTQ